MIFSEKNKEEKCIEIFSNNICRAERHDVALYLNALRKNDIETLNEWERFGNSFRMILLNKKIYDRAALFGINDLKFNAGGLLECEKLYGLRKIDFVIQKRPYYSNYIEIGHGKNNTWAYGLSCSTATSGKGYRCDIWSEIYYSEKDAIQAGLEELMKWHCDMNHKDNFSKEIVKQIERKLKDLREPIQLELF